MNPASPSVEGQGGLRKNTIGVVGMVLFVIAITAPLTALSSNIAISLAFGAGEGTVGVLALVLAILLVFSVGYVALSRQVVNAGAYFAYIGFGLGKRMGSASAVVATIAYNLAAAAMAVAVGYFGSLGLETYLHLTVPWQLIAAVTMAAVWLIGYLGVSISSKVNAFVAVTEFAILFTFAGAVLIHRPEGFSLKVFTPSEVFGGNFGLALVFCLLSFAAYEAAAIYGEEARSARRNVGRATYASLIVLAVTFILITWAIVAAVSDVVATAAADPGLILVGAMANHLGAWSGPVLMCMITFSFFAAASSFHGISSRYLFSLGRDGFLPTRLARTHPSRQTPVAAGTVQLALSAAIVVPFAFTNADPIVTLFPAVGGINALALIYLMSTCCVSIVCAAMRGRISGSIWTVRAAPAISCVALLACGGVIMINYKLVTGSDSPVIAWTPVILLLGAIYGWLAARPKDASPSEDLAPALALAETDRG